jgi:hypothetical protein
MALLVRDRNCLLQVTRFSIKGKEKIEMKKKEGDGKIWKKKNKELT